jgi:hypothetical protein
MKENVATLTSGNTVLNALAKGVCPICSLVRAFQIELIERLRPNDATTICNYHAWAVAASAPASSAAELFLAMLRGESRVEAWKGYAACDLCSSIRLNESDRLREFVREMNRTRFARWLEQYGTLCRFHGTSLHSMVSEEQARIIAKVIKSNQQQLEELLESFAAKARNGGHVGGGILGRAAEFLIAQRGLTR